jgi:hypothetical protein
MIINRRILNIFLFAIHIRIIYNKNKIVVLKRMMNGLYDNVAADTLFVKFIIYENYLIN